MILLNASGLEYSVPGRLLFQDVGLSLLKGEKVGLIGRNGTGKSTLLKILDGVLSRDSGEVTVRSGVRVRLLDQLPSLESERGLPLHEVVARGGAELQALQKEYESVCEALDGATEAQRGGLERRLNELTDELTLRDAWDLETRARTLLTSLGFTDPDRRFEKLSGGQERRLALARTLLVPPDVLLLDEPTNHLDIGSIAWLEEYLRQASFAVLMVTHDRFFLERVCTRMFELAEQTLHAFEGNYSRYLELKEARVAQRAKEQDRYANVLRREQAWLRQGPKARSTRQKARLQRVHAMLDGGAPAGLEGEEIADEAWDLGTRRLGKKVLEMHDVRWRILKGLDFVLEPGERVGVVGPNGSGKSTFLHLLAGVAEPDAGQVLCGETVHRAYFDQHTDRLTGLPPETRVLAAVEEVATELPLKNGGRLTAGRLCEMFLFSGSAQSTPIGKLSGGERKRLELLRLLMEAPNVFLADEPTNDLDLETLGRLEYFFDSFPGSLVVVSHDRFLLSRVCDRILLFQDGRFEELTPAELEGSAAVLLSKITEVDGGESETESASRAESAGDPGDLGASASSSQASVPSGGDQSREGARAASGAPGQAGSGGQTGSGGGAASGSGASSLATRGSPAAPAAPARTRKLTYGETRELATLEKRIPKLEAEAEELDREIAAKADRYSELKPLLEQKETLNAELEAALERWAELEEVKEQLQG